MAPAVLAAPHSRQESAVPEGWEAVAGSDGVGIGDTLCARERGESHRRRGYACHDQSLDVDLLDVHAESFPNRLSWAVFRIGSDSQFTRHQPTYAFFARAAGLQARSRAGPRRNSALQRDPDAPEPELSLVESGSRIGVTLCPSSRTAPVATVLGDAAVRGRRCPRGLEYRVGCRRLGSA